LKKILTIILDGFGMRDDDFGNAIKQANMETFWEAWNNYPHSLLEASGEAVGLTEGQMGNSEVGHMTIGAGRLIKQNELLVNEFLDENYKTNTVFQDMLEDKNARIHIMGLASDGNVHAGIDDFLNLFKILVANGIKNIYFHLITDGRDTDIHSSYNYIQMIESRIKDYGTGSIATISGRYYAMDRDQNFDRTRIYYDLVTRGRGINTNDIHKSIGNSYQNNITDEFIKPLIMDTNGLIKDGDKVIWMNYREDRSKQILEALTINDFDKFPKIDLPNLKVYSFLPIDEHIPTICFMDAPKIDNTLGVYISNLGITQARIAETEKYAHVTYFFDGGYNGKLDGCDKFLVASPKVATYDLKPEMSCVGVTRKAIKCMEDDYDFILMNFANPDMVGHTGNMEATIQACKDVDACLKKIMEIADDNFYKVIILADHGNADEMIDELGEACTTHTLAKVPFIIRDNKINLRPNGDLTMVAPTILTYMDIAVPKEMMDTPILIK
jgi:2,3-bisphosphoglycerate-independent phosphoglycerate mutase